MIKKMSENIEERLLSSVEIDEKIAELQKMKLLSRGKIQEKQEILRITNFEELKEEDVFDYKTFYEVTDVKNSSVYYLNGVQVAALFGMNEEYKKQFFKKNTNGQAQLEDKLVSFYYKEER